MYNHMVILAITSAFLFFVFDETLACPNSCQCDGFTVSCQSKITEFPKGIPTNTEKLMVYSSDMTHIPENALQNLVNLKHFDLQKNNRLRSIPAKLFDKLYNLEIVTISLNNISTIPGGLFTDLPKLETLYLTQNKIVTLPELLFKNVPELSLLEIGNNMISNLPVNLFDSSVTKLNYIDFSNNRLSSIPENFFNFTKDPVELILTNNKFNIMPVNAFKPLIKDGFSLTIKNNPLFCNCSLKPFADLHVNIHGDISCSDGVTVPDLSHILHTCDTEVSTPSHSYRTVTTFPNTTEKMATTSNNSSTKRTESLQTTQPSTIYSVLSKLRSEGQWRRTTLAPNDGDADNQDGFESSKRQRKTLILAISISAVAFIILVAFILWLFHTGILSTRCNTKFNKSKVVILDAEGNVLVKDGRIIT